MRILNLGAGVQSTTIALMAREPDKYPTIGQIHWAIFADTGDEPQAVYQHLEWLQTQVPFPILIRTRGNLGNDLIQGTNSTGYSFISIPAFTTYSGELNGQAKRQCTHEYKVAVIERTIRRELFGCASGRPLPKDAEITQIYGLSYDEAGRIARVKARALGEPVFPLFAMEMTRRGCQAWLKKHYPAREIPRSACVYCPYHSNAEWRSIRQVPEDWNRAVEIDRAIRKHDPLLFVHRDCVPLDEADLDDAETKDKKKGQEMFGFLNECMGMCGT